MFVGLLRRRILEKNQVSRLRYFTYISDAKVDVFLAQIPHQHKEKIASDIGFNIGVLSGKIASETNTLESRVSRVLAVERFIRDKASEETLGTPSQPQAWIQGSATATAVNVGKVLCCMFLVARAGILPWLVLRNIWPG